MHWKLVVYIGDVRRTCSNAAAMSSESLAERARESPRSNARPQGGRRIFWKPPYLTSHLTSRLAHGNNFRHLTYYNMYLRLLCSFVMYKVSATEKFKARWPMYAATKAICDRNPRLYNIDIDNRFTCTRGKKFLLYKRYFVSLNLYLSSKDTDTAYGVFVFIFFPS